MGAAVAGLVLGAAAVSLFHAEFLRSSEFTAPDKTIALLPASDVSETEDQRDKIAVRASTHEQPSDAMYNRYQQGLLTDVPHSAGASTTGISLALRDLFNPFTSPDYTSPEHFEPPRPETSLTAEPLKPELTASVRDRASEAAVQTNKIAADMTTAPPETGLNISVHDRASQAGLRRNKITADVIATTPPMGFSASVRDRTSETGARKITADGSASIQGFVKDAKGEPIKGAEVRIESRDGKQIFSTLKTNPTGRYTSKGLQPGAYKVILLVNGAVKASTMNTQTKANEPTQLNFDFKPTSQASKIAKGGKHMVWVPNRTGSHIGGNWVEVDDEGNPHFDSNSQTYSVRR